MYVHIRDNFWIFSVSDPLEEAHQKRKFHLSVVVCRFVAAAVMNLAATKSFQFLRFRTRELEGLVLISLPSPPQLSPSDQFCGTKVANIQLFKIQNSKEVCHIDAFPQPIATSCIHRLTCSVLRGTTWPHIITIAVASNRFSSLNIQILILVGIVPPSAWNVPHLATHSSPTRNVNGVEFFQILSPIEIIEIFSPNSWAFHPNQVYSACSLLHIVCFDEWWSSLWIFNQTPHKKKMMKFSLVLKQFGKDFLQNNVNESTWFKNGMEARCVCGMAMAVCVTNPFHTVRIGCRPRNDRRSNPHSQESDLAVWRQSECLELNFQLETNKMNLIEQHLMNKWVGSRAEL